MVEMREGLSGGDPRMGKLLDIIEAVIVKVDEIDRSYLRERIGPHEP
jgi:hypothetical protein